jgi:hypothetical protein
MGRHVLEQDGSRLKERGHGHTLRDARLWRDVCVETRLRMRLFEIQLPELDGSTSMDVQYDTLRWMSYRMKVDPLRLG